MHEHLLWLIYKADGTRVTQCRICGEEKFFDRYREQPAITVSVVEDAGLEQ